jgi:predicted RNase H-like HicB family nuclease
MPSIDFTKLIPHESQLPHSIEVKIGKSKDGGFWVEILSLPGCFTQAENGEGLFVMINDAVYTYLDIPAEYFPFLPRFFPTEKLKKKIQTWDKCAPANLPQRPITIIFTQGASR